MIREEMIEEYNRVGKIAEDILTLRAQASLDYTRFSPNSYELKHSIGKDGVTFYDVNQAQWDDGWEIDHETVSWADIDNGDQVIDYLKKAVAVKKRREAEAIKDSRRQQYENLKKEFGNE